MTATTPAQNRRSRRSNLFMAAVLEVEGERLPVRLRNLSRDGALVEGDRLPHEGTALLFEKGDLRVKGTVAWTHDRRAGISFLAYLDPEAVLRHIPQPKPLALPKAGRPGLKPRS